MISIRSMSASDSLETLAVPARWPLISNEHLALEVTALAVRGPAADVDRGLTGRPFAEKADGVLREQVGDGFCGRALDFGPFNDLDRADHTAALSRGSDCTGARGWRIRGHDVASADD